MPPAGRRSETPKSFPGLRGKRDAPKRWVCTDVSDLTGPCTILWPILPSPPCVGVERGDAKGRLLGLSLQALCRGLSRLALGIAPQCLTPVAQLYPWTVPRRLWGWGRAGRGSDEMASWGYFHSSVNMINP